VLPEAWGTPLPSKTPVNFAGRKAALEKSNNDAMKRLLIACFISLFFIVVQLIGGYLAKSIAIFTDSAHLASDILGFFISMMSLKCAAKPASKELSYGWHRSEILGTLVSIIFIWGLTLWLVYEATLRIIYPQPVIGGIMLVVAILGLFFNIIQMKILGFEDDHHRPPKA
jgi:zinc transporter 2